MRQKVIDAAERSGSEFSITSFRYVNGSTPCLRQEEISDMKTSASSPPLSLPKKREFLRLIATCVFSVPVKIRGCLHPPICILIEYQWHVRIAGEENSDSGQNRIQIPTQIE